MVSIDDILLPIALTMSMSLVTGKTSSRLGAVDEACRNRTQIEFVLGEAERGDVRRSVEFVGSRKFMFTHQVVNLPSLANVTVPAPGLMPAIW